MGPSRNCEVFGDLVLFYSVTIARRRHHREVAIYLTAAMTAAKTTSFSQKTRFRNYFYAFFLIFSNNVLQTRMTEVITHDKIATFARLTLSRADTSFYFSVVSLRSIESYLADEFAPPPDVRDPRSTPVPFIQVLLGRTPATAADATVAAVLDGNRSIPNFSALHLCAMLGHLDVIRMTPPDVLCHEASNTPLGLLTAAVWGG